MLRKPHLLRALSATLLSVAAVSALAGGNEHSAADGNQTVAGKVAQAVSRGASAAADGIERGARATEHGIRVGLHAAAHGVQVAAGAVERVAQRVAEKVQR